MSSATLIAAIDVKLAALIETPQVSYRLGDKTVNASDYGKFLTSLRESLVQNPDSDVTQISFDSDISQFGEDLSQYVL